MIRSSSGRNAWEVTSLSWFQPLWILCTTLKAPTHFLRFQMQTWAILIILLTAHFQSARHTVIRSGFSIRVSLRHFTPNKPRIGSRAEGPGSAARSRLPFRSGGPSARRGRALRPALTNGTSRTIELRTCDLYVRVSGQVLFTGRVHSGCVVRISKNLLDEPC